MHVYRCLRRLVESTRFPRARVIASSELHTMVLEAKLWFSAKPEHALHHRVIFPAPKSNVCRLYTPGGRATY